MSNEPEEKIEYKIRKKIDQHRIKEKDTDYIETVEEVFDTFTLNSLYDIMRKLKLTRLYGVVNTGKEARVYRAIDKEGKEYAVKIYLTFTSEFKKGIWKYIYGDPRFEYYKPTSTRKLMILWAKKEYKNLEKLYKAGVTVPKPYGVKDNILVMDFIGEDGVRAPLLKELQPTKKQSIKYYKQILDNLQKIVCQARMVHADLSEYNIMIHQEKTIIIDVAQAVLIEHPNALYFLRKDIENINRFFQKELKIKVKNTEQIMEELKQCIGTETI